MSVGVLPHKSIVLVLGRPYDRREIAALELGIELHLVLGVIFGLPAWLRDELYVKEEVHCMLLSR